jgi:hypothetical protein
LLALAALPLLICFVSTAQDFEVPQSLPSTKEEFVKSEKDMIAAAKWLENTGVGTDRDKRVKVNAWVIGWIINSPTVTIEVSYSFVKLFEKNPQLNILSPQRKYINKVMNTDA